MKKFDELALEYANFMCDKNDYALEEYKIDFDDCVIEAKFVLRWLLEKYYIVDKREITGLYKKMEIDCNHVDTDNDWAMIEALNGLEQIFGENFYEE